MSSLDGTTRTRDTACAWTRERLPLFVGDDLAATETGRVREHLVACCECRALAGAQLQALRAVQRLGESAPATARPVDDAFFAAMRERVLATVADEEAGAPGSGRGRWRIGARAAVAAAAMVCFGGGLWFGLGRDGEGLADRPAIHAHGVRSRPAGIGNDPPYSRLQPMRYRPEAGDGTSTPRPRGASAGQGMMGRLQLRTLEDEQPWMPTLLRRPFEDGADDPERADGPAGEAPLPEEPASAPSREASGSAAGAADPARRRER